jgi:MOSC domain-containing protein YiiM
MRILSVNSSKGITVDWNGRKVHTGIFKSPVLGKVMIRKHNLETDRQSDLRVHGGPDKAIYSYDDQDYQYWKQTLQRELSPGAFGENLTTEGLSDRDVFVGDILKVGQAVLQAVQPRLPCYKLGIRFGDDFMPKRFMEAERWGIYFRVLEEGTVEAGDAIEFINRDPQAFSVADLASILSNPDAQKIERALAISSLTEGWRNSLIKISSRKELSV